MLPLLRQLLIVALRAEVIALALVVFIVVAIDLASMTHALGLVAVVAIQIICL